MRRNLVRMVFAAGMGVALASGAEDPLLFPKGAFTVETKAVKASKGERKVTYRSYKHLPYVAKPVDKDYQSLDVNVPVEVDGVAVDASQAPILFSIPVGGYMAARNGGGGPGGGRGPGGPGGGGMRTRNTDLALAAGYVVVIPGVRGRNNKAADGTNYGKAPAAIVDLKAAIRYLRHNAGVLPGNVEWIVTTGVSAGGALSALVGASGDSALYESYLREIGAAVASDRVFGSADFCPILDLEHADMAYEWMWGAVPGRGGQLQDQALSKQLKDAFAEYQASLKLRGRDGFGPLTAANYDQYLLRMYLHPSATRFLQALTEEKRREYLAANQWISWSAEKGATFGFAEFLAHVGRMKSLPAFDDFDMKQPEPNEFGNKTTDSRHFTDFSLRHASGDPKASIDAEMRQLVHLMNPMYFIGQNNKGMAGHWWIRMGTSDAHTSLTVPVNLAASLENRKKNVSTVLYWDAGHGADEDAEDFILWIGKITGFAGGK
ncbi:MAG: hypothetical protein IPP47_01995 [Bryobacterales bacterium]|nr:hypothetical protein [Bryobacterales bacterium]